VEQRAGQAAACAVAGDEDVLRRDAQVVDEPEVGLGGVVELAGEARLGREAVVDAEDAAVGV